MYLINFSDFFTSAFSVDCIIFGYSEGKIKALLIKRAMEPYENFWAVPGDLVYPTEDLLQAAERILLELTGLSHIQMHQSQSFGKPNRHPQGRVITIAYFALVRIEDFEIKNEIESYDIKGKNNYLAKTISKNKTEFDKFEYHSGNNILLKQHKTVDNVLLILNNLLKYIDYTTENDYKILLSEIEVENNHNEISYPNNKATFNLSRTDSIIFLYLLEKFNLLKFESTSQRNSFIEQNFNYTEYRNTGNASDENENIIKELTGINVEYSNVKSVAKSNVKRYNKRLDFLKDKIQFIMEYEFKS
jgi:ADP-ribose pyrophosphatase YjhB (NUDIX family)